MPYYRLLNCPFFRGFLTFIILTSPASYKPCWKVWVQTWVQNFFPLIT